MRAKLLTVLISLFFLLVLSCKDKGILNVSQEDNQENSQDSITVNYAGVRSSSYGINPFPNSQGWKKAIKTMVGYFPGSIPSAIWIVGEMEGSRDCRLYFPSDGNQYPHISFNQNDFHETYLNYFDNVGIKVFLQVESADADIKTLIDLVLNRYSHHSCVIGFGIDVEWYKEADHSGWGKKVDNATAEQWEKWVKAHNPNYQLFLKHWDLNWMPKTYRGNIIFVDDSQGFSSLDEQVNEFGDWAAYFSPNTVFFQIGYGADKNWWGKFQNPPKTIGDAIAEKVVQKCGIFWVDFTLREVLPTTS